MNPLPQDDLYRKSLAKLGLVTEAQLEEILQIQSKILEIGIHEPIGDLLVKKGYLTSADHQKVLSQMGIAPFSIPGYTLLSRAGQGGMGTVYRALQIAVDRIVAIKVVAPAAAKDPTEVTRFIHEAQAAGKLHHQNLVAAIDVGFAGGFYYFVMEFVVGRSCRDLVRTKGPMPQSHVLEIASQMVDALGYIHEHWMVHRDVKPENMLLTDDGVIKLCDFGLAKSIGDVDAGLTQKGFTVGTPLFMSPEQIRGDRDIDIRSDLYSLGASLFYLLTGKPPYEGRSAAETLSMHLKHAVPEAHKFNPQVTADLSLLIHKLLSKDRKERYPSPQELKEDLERIRHGSAPRLARQHGFQLQISSKARIPQRSPAQKSPSPWPRVGAGVGGAAAVGVLLACAFVLSGQGPGGSSPPPAVSLRVATPPDAGRARPAAASDGAPEPGKVEYEEAQEIARLHPEDWAGRAHALERALRKGKDGPYGESARRDLSIMNGAFRKELGTLEERAKGLVAREHFKEALDLWASVLHLHPLGLWSEAVSAKIEEVDRIVVECFAGVRERALQARARQDQVELLQLRERTAKWGLSTYLADFDGLLADAEPEAPLPSSPAEKPPEEKSVSWSAAMTQALRRDYPAALRSLDSSAPAGAPPATPPDGGADRENLLLASRVVPEAMALLSKMTRGHRVALSYSDPRGKPARIDGRVSTTGAGRIEIMADDTPRVIPWGEIQAGALAELVVREAKDPGASRKAAALFCLLEGDAETARKVQGEPPPPIGPEYWEWAQETARKPAGPDPREDQARRLFYEAEQLWFEPAAAHQSAAQYRELLEKFGSTSFVRRNLPAIEARTAPRKDFILWAGDLTPKGSFKLVHVPGKMDSWASQKDLEAGEMKDAYVQAEFSALPELDYHCWVYAGGCCQEVLGFAVQGDEMRIPKPKSPKESQEAFPGSAGFVPVRFVPPFLRKRHAEHGGPKQAEKWFWIPVPLPKYAAAGTKTLRFLTDQRGFSIALVVVSSDRTASPKEAELKELERTRGEEPGYLSFKANGAGPAGEVRRELWEGIPGIWVRDLTGSPNFPDRPSRVETLRSFDVPFEQTPDTGSRIRGYIHPPATGLYVFWIAADDTGELWLSSDDRPEDKILLASAPEWTNRHEWEKHPSQKSRPVMLRAGHRYYIEALEKQGGGGSHLAVGWQLPDGTLERPIPCGYLSPYLKK